MAWLDSLDWPAGISFISYGLRIGVRTNAPTVLAKLPDYLPPGWMPAPSHLVDHLYSLRVSPEGDGNARHLLYYGGQTLAGTGGVPEALDRLHSEMNHLVARQAEDRVFVHAGVVACKGRAILVPGRSFSGKSELVRALVDAGATYYSDEYAVLDTNGCVHPYRKPLSLREQHGGGWVKHRLAVSHDGLAEGPLPVGLIVVTHYRPGARWQPRRISPGQAVLALLANTVPARDRPGAALEAVQRAAGTALALKGSRGEAFETVAALLDSLPATLTPAGGEARAETGS